MASEVTIKGSEYKDEYIIRTFGPYSAASFAAATDVWVRLPFLNDKKVVVDEVWGRADALPAAAAALSIAAVPSGTAVPANGTALAAGAAYRVTESLDWNSGTAKNGTVAANTVAQWYVHPNTTTGRNNNVVGAGSGWFIHVPTNISGTALSNLYITVRMRTARQ